MVNSGECDKVINYCKKKHRYIEMRKAKHDKKMFEIVFGVCGKNQNISHIPLIHEMKSIEMVKNLYCIVEREQNKEQKQ